MEHDSLLAYTYVLSIGTLGITQMLELNGILACFFSGLFFSAGLNAKERTEELQLQETADLLAGNLFFLMLGAVLPWGVWFRELSWWRLSVLAVSVNLLKRLPVVLAACRALPNIMSWREALLAGWFGPIGAASFLYALELLRRIRDPHAAREAYLVVTWMVMISVFLHSTTEAWSETPLIRKSEMMCSRLGMCKTGGPPSNRNPVSHPECARTQGHKLQRRPCRLQASCSSVFLPVLLPCCA
ncbi:Sodium/hydrogen exchanger family-domain-containing protein [Dunaliella salina]|nr:Sodium/hydrogen exchanger family-domain-containing protein [Dunaliella salina]|eukprot:KAF5830613.1 Sodium/hydrogen exchanger family-domain-containing protein [Dunaliella salina]